MKHKLFFRTLATMLMAFCCVVNVWGAETWTLVTDVSTLHAGDVITFVSSAAVDYNNGSSTKQNGLVGIFEPNSNGNNWIGTGVAVADGVLTSSTGVFEFTLHATSSQDYPWAFKFVEEETTKYIYAANTSTTSAKNYLKVTTDLVDAANFSISISEGVATITANGGAGRNVMKVSGNYQSTQQNSKWSTPIFNCYASSTTTGVTMPSIYKKTSGGGGASTTYTDYITECAAPVATLTYDYNGGTGTPASETSSPATLPTPTKVGYNFAGWCENSDLSDASPKTAGASYSFDESKTLYAKWTAKTYDITLSKNNTATSAGNADGSIRTTFGSAEVSDYSAATRAETNTYKYVLTGYYTTASGGDKIIDKDGKLVASTTYTDESGKWKGDLNSTLTLHAHWDNYCKVEWVNNGATVATTYVKQNGTIGAEGMRADLTSGDACSATYNTFIGWYTEASGTESSPAENAPATKVTSETQVTAKVKYYAVWADGAAEGSMTLVTAMSQIPNGTNVYFASKKDDGTPNIGVTGWNKNKDATYSSTSSQWAAFKVITISDNDSIRLCSADTGYVSITDGAFKINNSTMKYILGTNGYLVTKNAGGNDIAMADRSTESIPYYRGYKVSTMSTNEYAPVFIWTKTSSAAGYISTCCASDVVVNIAADDVLALNIEGQASTTVSFSKTATNTIWMYEPTISPAEGASFSGWSGTYKTADYNLTFTATKPGTYTITENALDKTLDCSKNFTKQIEVEAYPILAASVDALTVNGQCGVAGTAKSFTVNSRYLTSSTVTVTASTTSGSGAYKVSKDNATFSNSVTFDGGIADKVSQTIYVRYEGAADESGAIVGGIYITGGGATQQHVALSGTCACGTYVQLNYDDATATHVTAPKDQWTRTLNAIHIKGGYLTNNATNVNIKLTSSNSKFKFVDGVTAGSGSAEWASGSVTDATYNKDIYVVYTPTEYNESETTTITAQVITYNGTTVHATTTTTVYGRSLPEKFVIAITDKNDKWVAVPADMIPPYGGSAGACSTGVGTHDPYPITVDNETTPTKATVTPARAVYKGAARNTPNTWPWTVQFESNKQTGYMLWGSGTTIEDGTTGDPTTIANQNYATSARTKWYLITTDNYKYHIKLDNSLNENKLGYNGTADRIGQYTNTASNFHYNFRILPIEGDPCEYYINPVMTYAAYNATTSTLSIPYDGTTDYQYSIDNKVNWTDVSGTIDCKTLNLNFTNSVVKAQELWLRAKGEICNGNATSTTAMHMLNPEITATTPQEFNGVQNVAFNGEFAITTTDIWTGTGGGVQVASSNAAITATYNSTTGKVELSMAATSAGDYTTTLTISSVGAISQTVNVTIHIKSLATMNLTLTNKNASGLVCNAAATITTSAFYTAASTMYTSTWGGTGTYTLYNLTDGTTVSGYTGTISNGVVTITVPTTKMTVGNSYKMAWTNTQNLTDVTGLKYADAESAEFVFTNNCDAPTATEPCVTGPNSAVINWAGECGATQSTVSVYTKETTEMLNSTLTSSGNATPKLWKNYSTADVTGDWLYYAARGTADSRDGYGFMVAASGDKVYAYTPQIAKMTNGSTVTSTTELLVTVKVYATGGLKLKCIVTNTEPTGNTGVTTGLNVKFNGEPATEWTSSTLPSSYGYETVSFTLSGITATTSRLAFYGSATSNKIELNNVVISSVKTTPVKTISNATCSDGKQSVTDLTDNTTYYATVTNNGKTSNEVSFKTYTSGEKFLVFKEGDTDVTSVTVLGGAGQEKTITLNGQRLAGCDITTHISAGYSVDESALVFTPSTGAVSGSVVFTLTDPAVTEGTYTITDGAGTVYTLNLTSTNCPAGFSTMATAASDITANSANANWTGSVTSGAGTLVLYKNGIVDRELLDNGGFESGDLTGWNFYNVGALYSCDTYAVKNSNANAGTHSLYVSASGSTLAGMGTASLIYSKPLTLDPGTYRMTAYVKVPKVDGYSDKHEDFLFGLVGGSLIGSTNETVYYKSDKTTVYSNDTYSKITADLVLTKTVKTIPVVGVAYETFRPFYLDNVTLIRSAAPQNEEPYMNYDLANLSTGTQALSGLSGNTEYAYKLVNEDGCESNVVTFHTQAAGEPQITVPASVDISAPVGSTNSGVAAVTVTDAFDVVTITKCDDSRITLNSTTIPSEGGVVHYKFKTLSTDSPGDNGTCTLSFTTRGKSSPVTMDINWTVSAGMDMNTELIEVTDVSNSDITIEHNVPGTVDEVRVVFNRELEPDEVEENVGDEIFFSKYYEAYMHKKLWAIYNPTARKISLDGMQVWRSTSTGWNTTNYIDLSVMGKEAGFIAPNEEIIIYTADQVGACEAEKADMSEWTAGSSSNQPLSFSGDDALLLVRKVSAESEEKHNIRPATDAKGVAISWPDAITVNAENWHPLDIIGARTDAWLPDASATVKWSWTNCTNSTAESGDDKGWVGYGYDMSDNKSKYSSCTGGGYLLSTNRCLLVRRMTVKNGANALAINVGSMQTLNSEWKGSHVPTTPDDQQDAISCENFSYVGGYDYTGYYNHYTPLSEEEFVPLTQNEDGTYTFEANIPSYYCKNLRIEVVEKQTISGVSADNVHAYVDYKVPIVVDADKQTNNTLFTTSPLSAEICSECDIVIRDAAKLSHVSGGQSTFRDMYVYPGAKLSNEAKKAFKLRTIYMQAENDNVSYAIVNNNTSTILSDRVIHTKRIDNAYWYTFSLPYDCKIASIRQYNGKSLGKYEGPGVVNPEDYGDWTIKYYDGEARQTAGTSAAAGAASDFWKEMPGNGTLKANQAYIIGMYTLADNHKMTVYFPPTEETPYTESGDDAKTTKVVNWAANLSSAARHHGWNFVGHPYISMFNEGTAGQGLNNGSVIMMGEIDGESYINTDNVYVSIPDGGDSRTYTQVQASATKLKPFTGYFVQVVDPTSGSSEEKPLTYAKAYRTLVAAPARTTNGRQKVLVELNVMSPDSLMDNAGVVVDDRFTTGYEIGGDLTKMYAQDAKPQLYTVAANGEKLAYNALPDSAADYVQMGLYAPKAGNYVLSLNRQASRLQDAAAVDLLYQGQQVANLLLDDYTISAQKGSVSGYSLRIHRTVPIVTSTSDIDGVRVKAVINEGVITLENLPENSTVMMYDMLGKLIARGRGSQTMNLTVPAQGVYNISVCSAKGNATIKTIVK